MTVRTFDVVGLTCEHCVRAVSSELGRVAGVTGVDVELAAGGTSVVRITSEADVDEAAVAAALDEAGEYRLA